jgi:anti-anti-sigma regulatory factor
MMRIHMRELGDVVTLQVEGRLAGPWVCELEDCWHAAVANDANRKCSVDLTGVTFVDQAGWYLLKLMHRDGVTFATAGIMAQEILQQVGSIRK